MAGASNLTREQQQVLNALLGEGRNIRDPRVRRIYERAAVQTGLVESNLTNPSGGDADSAGWRQERASLYPDPTNLQASARRFRQEFEQQYDPGEHSYDVAAQVQRPRADLRGRYRDVAGQAASILQQYGGGGGAPASSSASGAPATTPDLGGGTDSSALLALLGQQSGQPRPSSSTPLPAPAATAGPAMPDAYKALSSGSGPGKKGPDVGALLQAAATPGQAAANVAAQGSPLVAEASSGGGSGPSTSTGGAQAALGWAESKLGFKESGTNAGGLASYLNQQFGMSNAPWCAMFTSAAVTKGGAPASARTASVAEIRRQAEAGGGGYQKGFVDAGRARPGDLILFGNNHVGMVRSVKNGRINYVGGNQSDGVTEASVPVGGGDIVRPRYGARKR